MSLAAAGFGFSAVIAVGWVFTALRLSGAREALAEYKVAFEESEMDRKQLAEDMRTMAESDAIEDKAYEATIKEMADVIEEQGNELRRRLRSGDALRRLREFAPEG